MALPGTPRGPVHPTPLATPVAVPREPVRTIGPATVDAAHEPRAARPDPGLARATRWAQLLDRAFVDPVLGLVLPGAGDVLGAALGLYTIVLAVQRRVSPVVIARMLGNLALDAMIGVVPLVGDLFDLGFRANVRNVALLSTRTAHGGRATRRDWLIVVGAAAAFVGALGLAGYAVVAVVRAVL